MHRVGTDLQLDRLALRPDHRGVQRLVHVELRDRDVVLEPPGNRVPPRVQHAEHAITVRDGVDEDAYADEVEDVGELAAADEHLLVDRVVVLGPAGDLGLELDVPQVGLDVVDDALEELLARRRAVGDEPHDLVVDLGVQGREREVLELPLDRVHAEPVRQRREDLDRLARDALLLVLPQVAQRAHVVQPIGELDDQHADVAAHRHDHLADRLGLRRVAVLDLVELGHAVDELPDLVAEVGAQLRERVVGVLDGVVQQRRTQGRRRHAELGEDRRHRERVGDVGIAALAGLPLVHPLGDLVRLLDRRDVALGMGRPIDLDQRVEHRVGRPRLATDAGQPVAHTRRSRRRVGILRLDRRRLGAFSHRVLLTVSFHRMPASAQRRSGQETVDQGGRSGQHEHGDEDQGDDADLVGIHGSRFWWGPVRAQARAAERGQSLLATECEQLDQDEVAGDRAAGLVARGRRPRASCRRSRGRRRRRAPAHLRGARRRASPGRPTRTPGRTTWTATSPAACRPCGPARSRHPVAGRCWGRTGSRAPRCRAPHRSGRPARRARPVPSMTAARAIGSASSGRDVTERDPGLGPVLDRTDEAIDRLGQVVSCSPSAWRMTAGLAG